MFKKTWTMLLGLGFAASLTVGCDHITNAVDCHGICHRYADCFDKSYDTDGCENRCKDSANNDKNARAMINALPRSLRSTRLILSGSWR